MPRKPFLTFTCLGFLLVTLLGCGPSPQSNQGTGFVAAGASQDLVARSAAAPGAPEQQKRIALSHIFNVRLPSRDIERVQKEHLALCADLGCTVLSTNLDRAPDGRVSAMSSIRISPDGFAKLVDALGKAPAQIVSHSERAEDKTLPFLDIEKRLEAKLALRQRLQEMLADKAKKSPADLVAIEKELAQVQGDIESGTAQRDYLKTITETIQVSIYYNGTTAQAGGIDFSPIERAYRGIGTTIVSSVASMVSFVAAALPWLPLAALALWGLCFGLRRWKVSRT